MYKLCVYTESPIYFSTFDIEGGEIVYFTLRHLKWLIPSKVSNWLVVSNIVYVHPYLGEMIQFEEHIFQMG